MMMSCFFVVVGGFFLRCRATQPTNTRRHAIPEKMSLQHTILNREKQQCCQAVLCSLRAGIPATSHCSAMFSRPKTHSFAQKQNNMATCSDQPSMHRFSSCLLPNPLFILGCIYTFLTLETIKRQHTVVHNTEGGV